MACIHVVPDLGYEEMKSVGRGVDGADGEREGWRGGRSWHEERTRSLTKGGRGMPDILKEMSVAGCFCKYSFHPFFFPYRRWSSDFIP